MKKVLILAVGFILVLSTVVNGEIKYLIYLNGPSLTKHFWPIPIDFNNFHLGIGFEAYVKNSHWLIGGNGHFMFNDSANNTAYWIGIAPGYFIGNERTFWGSLALIVGGIKKMEYNGGRFSLFGLPYLSLGYNQVGINVEFIPKIVGVTYPILIFQLKILLYPWHRL